MNKAQVYYTPEISPGNLVKLYEALGVNVSGKVGIKLSFGEPGNPNYLKPDLIKDLVHKVNGTLIEANTAYGGGRGETAAHLAVAKDHGFADLAPIDILDAEGEMEIPIKNGKNITVDIVGKNLANYDYIINLAHFKGHGVAGFGGVLKNQAIGIASVAGKAYIHTAGLTKDAKKLMQCWSPTPPADIDIVAIQDNFLESMAEAAQAVEDYLRTRTGHQNPILYINIMNNLSRDCDCDAEPETPLLPDMGMMASLDPVALDQASVDLIYQSEAAGRDAFVERIETQNAQHILEYAEKIGLGTRGYKITKLD